MTQRTVEIFVQKESLTVEATQVNEYRELQVFRDKGNRGDSAYEVAIANGFVGTEEEWLLSLKGEPGEAGANGKSAYQSYLETTTDDPVMTEGEWANQLGNIETILDSILS
ncbi:MAG: hypothetical protein JXQ80_12975 [Bacteroidales bacterium]|nr:hypothetical protein [Bacteroidales bacterium]